MTIAFLELMMAALLAYAAVVCVKFWPLLAGRRENGTHCTGSLVALIVGVIGYGFAGFFKTLLTGVGIGAAAGAAAKGRGVTPTTPTEPAPTPAPTPEPAPAPEIPLIPEAVSSTTGKSSGTSTTFGVNNTPGQATTTQAQMFQAVQA